MKVRDRVKLLGSTLLLALLGVLACAAVVFADGSQYTIQNPTAYGTGLIIQKEWDDNDNADNIRPESITVRYKITVQFPNQEEPEVYSDTVVLREPDWSYKSKEEWSSPWNVPSSISIEIEEIEVPEGYTAEYSWTEESQAIGNGNGPIGKITITNIRNGNLSISKTVSGEGVTEADEDKPFSFTLNLADSNGTPLTGSYSYEITGPNEETSTGKIGNGGTFALKHDQTINIKELPVGTKYSVTEAEDEDYISNVTTNEGAVGSTEESSGNDSNESTKTSSNIASGTISAAGSTVNVGFENERIPKTKVTVKKIWEDGNNPNRPESVQVQLYRKADNPEGTDWEAYGEPQTLNSANGWTYTWEDLEKTGYIYKVGEIDAPDGYDIAYSNEGNLSETSDGLEQTITNSLKASTKIHVRKDWQDGDRSDLRPDSVKFQLYYKETSGEEWIPYPDAVLELNVSNKWEGSFENLPVFVNGNSGNKFIYTVAEVGGAGPLTPGDKLTGKDGVQYIVSYPENWYTEDWTEHEANENGSTIDCTITNILDVMDINVFKEWKGSEAPAGASIYVGLYKDGQAVTDKYIELTQGNEWQGSFEDLIRAEDYTVKELQPVQDGEASEFTINGTGYMGVDGGGMVRVDDTEYQVSYGAIAKNPSDSSQSSVIITNQAHWRLIKRSSSSTDDNPIFLSGAEFELKHTDGTVYTGTSGEDGIVSWQNGSGAFTGVFPDGTYTLKETKAPDGYSLGNEFTFTISGGVPMDMDGKEGIWQEGILTFYYDNSAAYQLPSAGGTGIFWYMVGGILLMASGALILFRKEEK